MNKYGLYLCRSVNIDVIFVAKKKYFILKK